MRRAVKGYKLKTKTLEIERDSLEGEYKKKTSESQRERKKLHVNLKVEVFAKQLLWKILRRHDAQSLFSAHPSLFDYLLLPGLAPIEIVERHFKSLYLLCYPDKGGREDNFKVLVAAHNFLMDPEARKVYHKRGLEAAKDVLLHEMDT